MSDYDKILGIARSNNNIVKTEMIVNAGIRKERIKELLKTGDIYSICRGYYGISGEFLDRYYVYQFVCSKAIYSHSTAAYILGLLEEPERTLECTFPQGFHAPSTKLHYEVKKHYVLQEFYELGIIEINSPHGSKIRIYDKERVVCDFIKHKNRYEVQVWGRVVNNYFKSRDKNLQNLIYYAKKYHILEELQMYVELLQ